MKRAARTALVLGTGYLLGRRKRLGVALVLGGAAAAGRLSTNSGGLLRRGVQALGGSADLGKVLDLRGPLLAASKAAATSAVSNRIDSVSDRLQNHAESLRGSTRPRDDGSQRDDDARDATDDYDDEAYDDDEPEPEPQPEPERRSAARRTTGGRSRRPVAEPDDRDRGEEPEEEFDAPPRQAPRSRPASSNAPVRRRGR